MEKINKAYKGKKVLVTGHTGFKGSWLSIWLNHIGANVIGLALESKNINNNYNLANVSNFVDEYFVDIRDKEKLNEVFLIEQPEIVFHLAAQALVLDSYNSPLETFETNTMGVANILEAVRHTKSVKTAVIITTDKVYDNKEWIWPYREDERIGGYDPYSASKGAAELIISSYRNSFFNPNKFAEHGKSIASVRAGNVIGGGDWAENRIIPDCIRALQEGKSIEVRSPLSVRPWQHVIEPLGGYLLLGANMIENPKEFASAWNFGPESGNIVNVGHLVDLLVKNYGKGEWLDKSNSESVHEAKLLSLDINKAKYNLNWQPLLDINQTIEYTVDWYKRYKSEDVLSICVEQIKKYTELWNLKNEN